jgi:hypothetical protein
VGVTDFALGQPTLDEVFFVLTGHAAGSSDGDDDDNGEDDRQVADRKKEKVA